MKSTSTRCALLDELRGLDLISMMLYHGMWDLVYLFGVRAPWYGSWQGELWQQSICWVFILLSGFCLPLGHWLITLPGFLYANYFTAYLGFYPFGFFSTDYFPLTPWLFLFWAGFYLHHLAERTAQSLRPLRRSVCPPLGWLGRNSLMLYLLHQPVIYGVLTMVFLLLRRGGGAL